MLHRDVSVTNIMFEMREEKPFFILNDCDPVPLETSNGENIKPSCKNRTGTLPFMPCEVLENLESLDRGDGSLIPHILRYDFESLYWVSLWCAMAMEPVKDANLRQDIKTTLSNWETGSFHRIASWKRSVFMVPYAFNELPVSPLYEPCRSWLNNWNDIFSEACVHLVLHSMQRRKQGATASMDFETIDGIITKDTILEAIASE